MLNHIENLNKEKQQKLFQVIARVTILIGGADGDLTNSELDWAEQMTKIRSFSYEGDLKDYYLEVGKTFETDVNNIIQRMPFDVEERTVLLSNEIAEVNEILPELRADIALILIESWKSFAKHVAKSSGGFLSYFSVGPKEAKLIDLDMIKYESPI